MAEEDEEISMAEEDEEISMEEEDEEISMAEEYEEDIMNSYPTTGNTYFPDGGIYENNDPIYWATSAAMARNTSNESQHTNYLAASSGQYDDIALSPSFETTGNFNFPVSGNVGTYIMDEQDQDPSTYNAGGQDFQFQYYDFITTGDSGQGPYWRLKQEYRPTDRFPETLLVSNSDVPRPTNNTSGKHVCLEPFCNSSPFGRKSDLIRHYQHLHRDASQKTPYLCDWKRCVRSKDPFYRLDHYREHLREFHCEDLARRGSNKESTAWWENRNINITWWRCAKCLSRIFIDSDGFECTKCKKTCEPERRKLRGYK